MNNHYFQTAKPLNQQLQQLMHRMHAHAPKIARVSYAKYNREKDTLVTYADSEFQLWSELHHEKRLSKLDHLKRSAAMGVPRIIDDLAYLTHCDRLAFLRHKGYRSSAAIPCFQNHRFSGFVFLNAYEPNVFDSKSLLSLAPYIEMLQFAVESHSQVVNTIVEFADRLRTGSTVYCRDSYYHGRRMRAYTKLIAEYVADHRHLDDEQVDAIAAFSQIHDIGKTLLPDTLICDTNRFEPQQLMSARSHIDNGIKLMDEIVSSVGNPNHPSITLLNQIMRFQYEYLDGSGYPYGFSQEEVPLAARIVTVANIFDSMTTHRSYKQACSVTAALLELEKMVQQGKLDALCVDALRLKQEYLKQIIHKYPEPEQWGRDAS
ncbi:HD-GYP domain-containing protein [Vibrio fluminensis]|uniref:HD-GYP domain-containing protein n=1 Tax=Vibrio fluminensis TaxID=2783614 RepID=UPI0018898005|nr:HD domain-containing phosphohydrolase [Vibrio fluminensis]